MSQHEQSDANVSAVGKFAAGLLFLMVFAMALMWYLFDYLAGRPEPGPEPSPMATGRELPPEPRLQVTPPTDLELTRQKEDEMLNSYGWVDREAGVVRIPIDRAMDLLLERGLPTSPAEEGRR